MKAVEYVNEPRRIGSGACCFMGVDKSEFSAFWIWFFERNPTAFNAARCILIFSRSSGDSSPGGARGSGIGVNKGSTERTEPPPENPPEFNTGIIEKQKEKGEQNWKSCMCWCEFSNLKNTVHIRFCLPPLMQRINESTFASIETSFTSTRFICFVLRSPRASVTRFAVV